MQNFSFENLGRKPNNGEEVLKAKDPLEAPSVLSGKEKREELEEISNKELVALYEQNVADKFREKGLAGIDSYIH